MARKSFYIIEVKGQSQGHSNVISVYDTKPSQEASACKISEDFLRFTYISLCKTDKPQSGAIVSPEVII